MATIADRDPGGHAHPAQPRSEGHGALIGLAAAALLALALVLVALTNPPIGDESPSGSSATTRTPASRPCSGWPASASLWPASATCGFWGACASPCAAPKATPVGCRRWRWPPARSPWCWCGWGLACSAAALDQQLHAILDALTYHLLAQAGAAAAVMVGATALLVRRTSVFPRWFGNTSAAIAVLLLLSGPLGLAGLGVGVALLAAWVALAGAVSLGVVSAKPSTTAS